MPSPETESCITSRAPWLQLNWGRWSVCDATCAGGTSVRRRSVVRQAEVMAQRAFALTRPG